MNEPTQGAPRAMRITLWGINYAPELIGIAPFNRDLGDFLAASGHAVTAVTAFPYYPHWRTLPGDRGRWHRAEWIGDVCVHRCWCYVPAAVTTLRRIAHELSFGLVSFLRVLALPRADVYLVVSPPLLLGGLAWIAARLKRSRFVFHVQDLQPDAAVGLGMIRGGAVVRALYALERVAYAKAAFVSGISQGMVAAFRRKGVPAAQSVLLPNWLRVAAGPAASAAARSAARRRFGVTNGALLAVYAGNLGRKQGLEILLEAVALLPAHAAPDAAAVRMIIAGDGAMRSDLERRQRATPGLALTLLPLLSDGDYAALHRAADVAVIAQAGGAGRYFFPSKLLTVLAAGVPVVAVADADSELAEAVREGGFGCVVRPGDPAGLAAVLGELAADRARLRGWAARTAWVGQFSRATVLPRFEALLCAVVPGRRAPRKPPASGRCLPDAAALAPGGGVR